MNKHTVLIMLSLAMILAFFWLLGFRKRLQMNAFAALILSFLCIVIGVLFMAFFAVAERGGQMGEKIGFSLFGLVLLMPVAFWVGAKITKRKVSEVFDILTIPMVIALICARVDCLLTGCCLGRPIHGTNGLRWPTREAEILFYLVFAICFAPKVIKGKTAGEVYPWYMLTYGIVRFVLETFRISGTGTVFHLSHLWAVVSLCIGFSFVIGCKEKAKRGK